MTYSHIAERCILAHFQAQGAMSWLSNVLHRGRWGENASKQTWFGSVCRNFNLKKLNKLWKVKLYKTFTVAILFFIIFTNAWMRKHLQRRHSWTRTHMYMFYNAIALPEYSEKAGSYASTFITGWGQLNISPVSNIKNWGNICYKIRVHLNDMFILK